MSDLTIFGGWELDTSTVDEPRVRDVDVAVRAGLAKPSDVRRIVDANWDLLAAHGEIRIIALNANNRGRPGREYWLTEPQAVALMSVMRTPQARELHAALVRLFVAYRRGQLAAPVSVTLDVAQGARVGEDPRLRAEIACLVAMTARAAGVTRQRVQGFVRKTYRVGSEMQVSVLAWPTVKATLEAIALGKIHIVGRARGLLPADRRQIPLFGRDERGRA